MAQSDQIALAILQPQPVQRLGIGPVNRIEDYRSPKIRFPS
jgi:hypothetical protein